MTDGVEPALTPEEWFICAIDGMDTDWPLGKLVDTRHGETYDALKVLALANAALPDDSPYKITRSDVMAIANAATLLNAVQELAPDAPDELGVADGIVYLRHLAAKLEALLPPGTL